MKDLKSLAGIPESEQRKILAVRHEVSMAESAFTRAMEINYWNGERNISAVKPHFDKLSALEEEFVSLRARWEV